MQGNSEVDSIDEVGLVCLATRRFDDAMPTIVQHLMRAVGRQTPVLYVEPPVDPVYLARRRRRRILHPPAGPDGIRRVVPLVLPFERRWSALGRLNRRLLVAQVRGALRRWGGAGDVLWIPSPDLHWIIESLGKLSICYYMSDDYTCAPALLKKSTSDEVAARQRRVMERAEWILVNSPVLLEKYRSRYDKIHWIPSGVDVEPYRGTSSVKVPADLEDVPRPIAGFVGAVDAYKLDFALLETCARKLPECSFVTVGPVGWTAGNETTPAPNGGNIHHLGWRPYDELPRYLSGFDVALLPNRVDGYMASNFPMKLFEYFAAGLPVVATNLPALEPFAPYIGVARNTDEFIEEIRRALGARHEERRRATLEIAENNTWARQAERVLSILRNASPAPVIPPGLAPQREIEG